ncbi:P-loop containing nucleoside triphosphate hydrolase protein [Phlyctochytrium arcticum]|nr:P-loop containing nucleoside triphosphate hydrolase protein [Phlyctochytrium arcticum]
MDFGNDGGSFASGPRLRQVEPHQIEIPQELLKNELPIFTKYQEIMAAIESNPVTILSAETGAGKTTQLPQFILSHIAQERKFLQNDPARPAPANIVVTQPRRIAAISVAQRVASERGEVIGRRSNVGYQVRFDDKRPTSDPESGHLIFCTSGILLKRLQENPSLTNVTHVILDEVHERDLNTDLLLIIVRHLLKRRPDLRVILMSATAETKLFQDYFRGFGSDPKSNLLPPVIAVPGRMFPVEKHFLEDVENLLYKRDALPVPFRPAKESLSWARNEMGSMIPPRGEDPVPYDYLEALIAHICGTRPEGAILCFLPGWQEIDTMMQRLKEDKTYRIGFSNEAKYRIYPLHSSIPTSAQQLIFDTPPKGVRKIILSTNIAETSVTINDVVYVVDAAKLRINSYDADRRISSLSSVWAATSNLRQRAGRAGRCQPGQYFSLLSHRRKESLPFSMPPELLRVDLQSTVLKIKALRLARRVADVFAAAPQPPSPGNVRTAMQELQKLGALTRDENLTSIGRVLANMPVDPWIGKMVLEAALLGCLDPILTLAGGMEIGRGVFAIHPDEKEQGRAHILAKFAVGTQSDHLTTLAAFSAWKSVAEAGGLGSRSFIPEAKDFARTNYLHYNSMANIERARQQLVRSLEDAGFVSRQRAHGPRSTAQLGGAERNIHANNAGMVRAILGGALYPNIAEVTAKDEYRSRYERVLRLTGSSVNSWKGVVTAPPPLPPRILAFQDKQRVDGALYMRSTTRVDPIALVLFADPQTVVRDTTELDKPAFWVDDWLQIRVPSVYHLRVLQELKMWMEKYLTWVFWAQSRANSRKSIDAEERKRMEQLGSMLIREIAALVEAANSNDLYRY